MISPSPADEGRRVVLPLFNAPNMKGTLVEVTMADMLTPDPLAAVLYDGEKAPVWTDIERLEWAE